LLSASSNNGCTKIVSHLISVYTNPVAGFTVSNVGNICSNTALNIINTSNVTGFGVVTKIEIYWDYIINPSDMNIDNSPVINGTYAHAYPVFGNPLTKTYRVLIKAYNGTGCSNEYFADITIHASPQIQFNPLAAVCQESSPVAITAASNTTGLTGTGVYSGNGISSGSIFNPSSASVGTNVLTYTFTGVNGCVSSANGTIVVNPTPVLNLGPNLNILEGDHLTLSPVQVSGTGLNYLWSPPTYLSNINIQAPVCTPINDITYSLTITSSVGCTTTDDVFIKVVKDFIVPNTFTPNGDGINDLWVIENLVLYPNSRIQVFNRYGQILYDSKQYLGDWDGTYKNKALPSGTYYYIIDLNGARVAKKGYVTIVR
jgi:gliding motility-associated-like protein